MNSIFLAVVMVFVGSLGWCEVSSKESNDYVKPVKLASGNIAFLKCQKPIADNCLNPQNIGRSEGYRISFLNSQRNEEYAKGAALGGAYTLGTVALGGVGLMVGSGLSYGSSATLTLGGAGLGLATGASTSSTIARHVNSANPLSYLKRGRLISKKIIANEPVKVENMSHYIGELDSFLKAIDSEDDSQTTDGNSQISSTR